MPSILALLLGPVWHLLTLPNTQDLQELECNYDRSCQGQIKDFWENIHFVPTFEGDKCLNPTPIQN